MFTYEIIHNSCPNNPIKNDLNWVDFICFHRNYSLGNNKNFSSSDYNSFTEMEKAIKKQEKPLVILPLFMYEHSGITLSTTPFSCRFDSGQLGFVFISKTKFDEMFGKECKGKKKLAADIIKQAVEIYSNYVNGDTYHVNILENGKYYDEIEYYLPEYEIEEQLKKDFPNLF